MKLRQIVYTSHASSDFDTRKLLDLLHQIRGNNSADNITGLLIYNDQRFLQIVEGNLENIEDLLQRLAKDPRHTELQIISDQLVEERAFPAWSMGCIDFSDPVLATLPGVNVDLSKAEEASQLAEEIFQHTADWQKILQKYETVNRE